MGEKPTKVKSIAEIVNDASEPDCKWKAMFGYVAAGYEVLLKVVSPTDIEAPTEFDTMLQELGVLEDNGQRWGNFAKTGYEAGHEYYGTLAKETPEKVVPEVRDHLAQTITMLEQIYYPHCKDAPIVALKTIQNQVQNL